MKVTHWTRLASVVIAGTIVSASAQAQQLPNAKDLHAKYVQALGGPEAIKKHEQMHLIGEFAVPAQGMSGNFDLRHAARQTAHRCDDRRNRRDPVRLRRHNRLAA